MSCTDLVDIMCLVAPGKISLDLLPHSCSKGVSRRQHTVYVESAGHDQGNIVQSVPYEGPDLKLAYTHIFTLDHRTL